ncbi:hypothetical protein BDP55DRAFT_711787 [Colletotrichum godetiae]|uniref:Guanylate-binding protein/Atlastin C-terminal domain-containing protein n=1 Tax=Colletotrichum godetiae TaxID=1209918 RepID=A0AAJ0ATR0_9PEZI|nr:uncharacterized protein BDP55DRAFT_711787 [Colletotrichum godetiae]KAK1690194.1 hypothetical protein BDP55DRAFT_711787 [Colletotrichum godetiae]
MNDLLRQQLAIVIQQFQASNFSFFLAGNAILSITGRSAATGHSGPGTAATKKEVGQLRQVKVKETLAQQDQELAQGGREVEKQRANTDALEAEVNRLKSTEATLAQRARELVETRGKAEEEDLKLVNEELEHQRQELKHRDQELAEQLAKTEQETRARAIASQVILVLKKEAGSLKVELGLTKQLVEGGCTRSDELNLEIGALQYRLETSATLELSTRVIQEQGRQDAANVIEAVLSAVKHLQEKQNVVRMDSATQATPESTTRIDLTLAEVQVSANMHGDDRGPKRR